ncbi:hypothetical protein DXG03_003758 [Asterophora parasitica]|uniref:Uncharacterized protein n=1 Tax=Asterophora parasitica TaxID=117018 RepID=A0A9P7G0V0_9AGAR|nr:hypothetical protein DXG03_003758 [Asterophora parasitica]
MVYIKAYYDKFHSLTRTVISPIASRRSFNLRTLLLHAIQKIFSGVMGVFLHSGTQGAAKSQFMKYHEEKKFKEASEKASNLDGLNDEVRELREEVGGAKTRMDGMKNGVETLIGDIEAMKGDVRAIKSDVRGMKDVVDRIVDDFGGVDGGEGKRVDVGSLISDLRDMKGKVEKMADDAWYTMQWSDLGSIMEGFCKDMRGEIAKKEKATQRAVREQFEGRIEDYCKLVLAPHFKVLEDRIDLHFQTLAARHFRDGQRSLKEGENFTSCRGGAHDDGNGKPHAKTRGNILQNSRDGNIDQVGMIDGDTKERFVSMNRDVDVMSTSTGDLCTRGEIGDGSEKSKGEEMATELKRGREWRVGGRGSFELGRAGRETRRVDAHDEPGTFSSSESLRPTIFIDALHPVEWHPQTWDRFL